MSVEVGGCSLRGDVSGRVTPVTLEPRHNYKMEAESFRETKAGPVSPLEKHSAMAKLISPLNARLLYVARDLKLKWAPRKLPFRVYIELHFPARLTVAGTKQNLFVPFFAGFRSSFYFTPAGLHLGRTSSNGCPRGRRESPLENCRVLFQRVALVGLDGGNERLRFFPHRFSTVYG